MTDPTPERIAAALRLAEAADKWYQDTGPYDMPSGWCDDAKAMFRAMSDYRATLPVLRTRAEVDAERLLNLDAWRANVLDCTELCRRDSLLCAEPTAPEEKT